jgi:predicted transcriptional regulator
VGAFCQHHKKRGIALYLEIDQWHLAEICQSLVEADAGDFASDAEFKAVFEKLTHAH